MSDEAQHEPGIRLQHTPIEQVPNVEGVPHPVRELAYLIADEHVGRFGKHQLVPTRVVVLDAIAETIVLEGARASSRVGPLSTTMALAPPARGRADRAIQCRIPCR